MATWPTSVATDAILYIAVNSLQTTLAGSIDNIVTTITLASTTNFPTAGGVTIDNEVIFYTGISGAQLTGCTRGADGTTAASHSSGVPVGATVVAAHHNLIKNEIIAIETSLDFTVSRAMTSNGSGRLAVSTVTATELAGLHSLTASRAIITDGSGILTFSAVTSTELSYLSGVTSAIQTQINSKKTIATGNNYKFETTDASGNLQETTVTASRAVVTDANGLPSASAVTATELGYVSGVTSSIQTQLNGALLNPSAVALTIQPTTNQLILGTTRTVTINAPTPASSSRTITIPDVHASTNFTLQLTAPGDATVGTRAKQTFDYFDRADQTLNTTFTPTGDQWILSGAGQTTATITSGAYIVTDNTYASLDYGTKITRIAGAFSFLPSTGADDITVQCMALIADVAQIGLSTMLHLQFSPQGWDLVQYVTGTPTTILSGNHQCVRDGSVYSIAMEFSGNTVYVIPPQGPIQSYTNASIGSTTYRYGIWQITAAGTSSGSGSFAHWNAATLGYDVGRANRAIGQGMPASQVDVLGTQTNDSARSGFKGEWLQSANPGVVAAGSTGTFKNYQTKDLTAGEWDVWGGIEMDGNGGTVTGYQTALSLFSGNTTTDHVTGYNNEVYNQAITTQIYTSFLGPFRVQLTGTTTVYLKMRWNFTGTTPQGDSGTIWARRVR